LKRYTHLNRYRYRVRLGYWEGLGYGNRLQDRVWGVDMLHDWDHDMFGDKLGHRKRLDDWVGLRDVDLLVDGIRFRDWNVFRHMFDDDLDWFGVFDMTIVISSMSVASRGIGHSQGAHKHH